ncbi:O-antigen polysaccharide polymerase Wzy [Myroides sp. LJL116]
MYKFYSILFLPLLILSVFLYAFNNDSHFSIGLLGLTLFFALVSICFFVFSSFFDPIKELRKQYIRPIFLFLVGYLIVFFQGYLDLFLGYIDEFDLFYFVHPTLINKAALLSLIGLVSLFLGYYSYKKRGKIRHRKFKVVPIKKLVWFFYFLLIGYVYFNIAQILYGSYSQAMIESSVGTIGAYMELLYYITYLSLLILHVINCRLNHVKTIKGFVFSMSKGFYVNVIIYLCLILISGDRGPILSFALTYMCALTIATKVKIKFKYIIAGIFAGAMFLSILGIVRRIDDNSSIYSKIVTTISEGRVNEKYSSVLPASAELSTSVRTLHYAMESVPSKYPYLFGLFQVRESLKIVPFASGIFDPIFDPHFRYKNSAFYITWLDKGEFYFVGSGSSINADLYLTLGEIGVFIGLFLIGRLFRLLDVLTFHYGYDNISLLGITMSIAILGSSIFWSRATLLAPIQPIALTFILVKFYIWNTSRK